MNNDFYRTDPRADPYIAEFPYNVNGWRNVDLSVSVTTFWWTFDVCVMDSTLYVCLGPLSFNIGWYSRD